MGKTNFFISWQRKKRVQSRPSGLTAKMEEGIKKKKKKKRRRYLEVPLLAFGSCHWPRVCMHTEAQAYKSISQQIPPLTAPPKHSDPASFGLHITSNSSHYDGKGGAGTTEECRSQRALTTQAFGLDHTASHSQLTSHTGSTVGNTTSASGPH